MPKDINLGTQKPATTNQISNAKPIVKSSYNHLTGYIANSINGGMWKPIYYKRYMGGEFDKEFKLNMNVRMLTPKCPSLMNLKMQLTAYWIPDKAVWDNAYKFSAQKGGTSVTKITEEPNLGGKVMPRLQYQYTENGTTKYKNVNWTDTDVFRDSIFSALLPRYLTGYVGTTSTIGSPIAFPKVSALPIRAAIKAWNEFERHKEYETAAIEYKDDTVTTAEWQQMIGYYMADYVSNFTLRGKRQNSYYTDYRTELLGQAPTEPNTTGAAQLINMVEWEKAIAEARSQSENSMLTDWEVVAKIRGTKTLKDGLPRILGRKVVNLNYSAVTQTTYNQATQEPEYAVMGTQGAYSYTEIRDLPMFLMEKFEEPGTVLIAAQVSADSVFETAFDRTQLDVAWDSKYRPDLKDMKQDVIYEIEKGTYNSEITSTADLAKVQGYKRRFSEWFKMPNCVGGDMTTGNIWETEDAYRMRNTLVGTSIITQKTFQFFEESDKRAYFDRTAGAGAQYIPSAYDKLIYKDYTDLLIDKNQAVQNGVKGYYTYQGNFDIMVRGQNQIFFLGVAEAIEDLPIDESIKENFTEWGEI